ncbi:TetR/AcrR family transcriptional regulator [Actinospica sp. MGRD01-02]|uniref:TetR/AcrR family transcriptional regulator n=1 Tax=Actinospica acidithermotolerans TaxID=2828514 RepID=A0A941IKD2_9ACTN|nr:TetR/AcrR family transcriptional regulator [Actinospica acidithermotolerans]MBR7828792.1 TetR/AcrR family transcriptional regulator [Actinospica acidithermotolerans]
MGGAPRCTRDALARFIAHYDVCGLTGNPNVRPARSSLGQVGYHTLMQRHRSLWTGARMPASAGGEGPAPASKGGRPRDPKVDEAILAAALEVLGEQGYARLSIEAVAQRAEVAKTSLYRRWAGKDALILDAVAKVGLAGRPEPPDTGSLHQDISTYLRALIDFRQAQVWVGEVLADPELKRLFGQHLGGELTAGFRTIIERAVERGELGPHTDVELLAVLPTALVHHHYVLTGTVPDEQLAQRIADQFFGPGARIAES